MMNSKQSWSLVLVVLALVVAGLACASSADEDQRVRTLVTPTAEEQTKEGG